MNIDEIERLLLPSLSVTIPDDGGNPGVRAAVLLLFAPLPSGPALGLIRRAKANNVHSGQISFPGGKIEAFESPIQAAFRETEEEIGVSSGLIRLLGCMPVMKTKTTDFLVWPVVGIVETTPRIRIAPGEVDEFFWLPASFLKELRLKDASLSIPPAMFEGREIWGLTLRTLVTVAKILYADR